jgi:SAM-dependent methyltransferase
VRESTDPRLVAIYDAVNSYPANAQPRFYADLAAETGARSIVDLGCGTGLITCDRARRGYQLTAVEPSELMLQRARLRESCDHVKWIHGEASRIGPVQADLAIMTGHVTQFFISDESWHDTLLALYGALRPGGRLAFESRNPDAREWEGWSARARVRVYDPAAGDIEAWSEVDDVAEGVVSYANHYLFRATGEHIVSPTKLRFRSRAELAATLWATGFDIHQVYGDWERRPVASTRRELIVVAGRPPQA